MIAVTDALRASTYTIRVDLPGEAKCGMIANDNEPVPGPTNMVKIIQKRLKLQGFIVSDHMARNPAICPATVALFVQRGASVVQVSNAVPLAITLQFSGGSWMLSGEE